MTPEGQAAIVTPARQAFAMRLLAPVNGGERRNP
jgi:hypothetical protein